MSRSLKTTAILALAIATLAGGCAYKLLFWERNIWQDFEGIFALVEPVDLDLYRALLPDRFSVPDQPMVGIYVVNFVDTEPWPMTFSEFLLPYLEATVLLRCGYEGQTGWYSLVMPVSTEAAMIGGHRLGFPKYVADEIYLTPTDDDWLGAVVHDGRDQISLRFTASRINQLGLLTPLQGEFLDGRGDADLEGPIVLLVPPGEGPKVNVLPTSPPPLVIREPGAVEITLIEPYNGLVPDGTLAPGLYQRFTLADGGGPPWIVVILFFAALIALSRFLLRKWKARRTGGEGPRQAFPTG